MRAAIKAFLSALIVASAIYNLYAAFHTWRLPFDFAVVDRHTLVIAAAPAVPLPAPLAAGDRIDPAAQDFGVRTALDVAYNGRTLPWGRTYDLKIRRGDAEYRASVTTQPLPMTQGLRMVQIALVTFMCILSPIGLLLLWRGRDRAATSLAAWCLCFVCGISFNYVPFDGPLGLLLLELSLILFLLARVAFYVMADTLVAPLLTRGASTFFRTVFVLVLLLGAIQSIGSGFEFAYSGDVELALPRYSLAFSWIFVVPVALLVFGYRLAAKGAKVKLGWVAFAGILLVVSVTITNAQPFGYIVSYGISSLVFVFMVLSLAYALLRLRVVSIAIVFDRALVYGLVTTLVVGVVAAMNSVALRAALPPGASLALQVIVPLALGIVLGRVREYLDQLVERVFFRGKYLAERALRSFARHVGHFDDAVSLLEATVAEIHRQAGTPAVAIYSAEDSGYRRLKHVGEAAFPMALKNDDAALVAARAERRAIDLASIASAVGDDACLFPMLVLGNLRGVIVCKNRPGEHFGVDEKRLLTHVAREVGAAWRILRARDNEALVVALAEGELPTLKAAREKARRLTLSWVGA